MSHGIIAAGPVIKPACMVAHRIVLRKLEQGDVLREFVVHTESLREDGSHDSFAHGEYFPVRYFVTADGSRNTLREAFDKAFKRWAEKVADKCKSGGGDNRPTYAEV